MQRRGLQEEEEEESQSCGGGAEKLHCGVLEMPGSGGALPLGVSLR